MFVRLFCVYVTICFSKLQRVTYAIRYRFQHSRALSYEGINYS